MGAGLFIEPAVVVILLIGGTWINRNYYPDDHIVVAEKADAEHQTYSSGASIEARLLSHSQSDSEASSPIEPTSPTTDGAWRTRKLALYRWSRNVHTPSTHLFRDRLISRILRKFPFIIEVIYWGLIYWVSFLATLRRYHNAKVSQGLSARSSIHCCNDGRRYS